MIAFYAKATYGNKKITAVSWVLKKPDISNKLTSGEEI